jgi:DNA invertase Pin-like site-specific DNA recombinase
MSADEQIERLRSIAVERGWTVASVFIDRPTTVRKGLDRRAGEVALLDAVRSDGVDKVLIWSIDRVGKSLVDLVTFTETCRAAGVSLWLHQQGVDSAVSNGMSMLDLSAMMALHLRQSRRDRILRGQAAARSLSIRFGRPPIAKAKIDKARIALAAGKGVRQAARLAGISAASASRLKSALGNASATA